jgi:metal-sulfur cluster biosynthetic enzyme
LKFKASDSKLVQYVSTDVNPESDSFKIAERKDEVMLKCKTIYDADTGLDITENGALQRIEVSQNGT